MLAPIFEGVFQQISNILNEALDILTGLFDIFAGIFTGDWDMVWQGVQEVFGAVWDFVVATFENWISTFTSLADTVLAGSEPTGKPSGRMLKHFSQTHGTRSRRFSPES